MNRKNQGFTLIEVMVVVAIISIIAGIGYPGYNGYMQKTRRVEAKTMLTELANEQQRFFTENNRYATDFQEIGFAENAIDTENGYYSVVVTSSDTNSYLLTATPKEGAAQATDTYCASFTINSAGAKGVVGATSTAAECW